jgi:hypothetical protein
MLENDSSIVIEALKKEEKLDLQWYYCVSTGFLSNLETRGLFLPSFSS